VIDRVLVVDVPEEIQLQRTIRRDQTSKEHVTAIISSQSPRADRLRVADDIIDNSGNIDFLTKQVTNLHHKYLGLSK
jgi:dephospho-CoA kinase